MNELIIKESKGLLYLTLPGEEYDIIIVNDPWKHFVQLNNVLENKIGIFDANNGKITVYPGGLHFSQNPCGATHEGEEAVKYFLNENINYYKNFMNHYLH